MKKIVFFMLFLAFTRVGFAAGLSPNPVGIGNFFLGTPKITDSNFNQVLGLLVGPTGQPGVAGVSGANGKDGAPGTAGVNGLPGIAGINGVNGVDGRDGTPGSPGANGVNGVQGPAGPAGPQGPAGPAGAGGTLGLGNGEVALGTCDDTVNIRATQAFDGNGFNLATIVVSNISGINGANKGCAGQDLIIHIKTTAGVFKQCTYSLSSSMTGANNTAEFNRSNCAFINDGLRMNDLDNNIGLEINGGV